MSENQVQESQVKTEPQVGFQWKNDVKFEIDGATYANIRNIVDHLLKRETAPVPETLVLAEISTKLDEVFKKGLEDGLITKTGPQEEAQ